MATLAQEKADIEKVESALKVRNLSQANAIILKYSAEALRDMNKASSNLMAQQVLLSMARAAGVPAPSPETAAAWLQAWLDAHAGTTSPTRLTNGSGLSRENRISPAQLAALLRWAWAQPWMPEFLASLPVAGLDGTLSRRLKDTFDPRHILPEAPL